MMALGAQVVRKDWVVIGVAEGNEVGFMVWCVGALHNISLFGDRSDSVRFVLG